MKNKNKINTAFSLVEISIVIIVIGILISGISSGIDLYRDYKITSARNYTINSKVSRIPDIGFWLDTTRLKSLQTASGSFDPKNGDKIKNWNSINYLDTQIQLIANQNNDLQRPIYIENGVGGLPSLGFNNSKMISIPYDKMFTTRYCEVYVIIKSNGIIGWEPVIGSGVSWVNGWFFNITGIDSSHKFQIRSWKDNELRYGAPAESSSSSNLNNLQLIRVTISDIGINARNLVNNISHNFWNAYNFNNVSTGNFWIGYQNMYLVEDAEDQEFFNGEISEIIYFTRNLNNTERVKVNEYFKEKYKLKF
jgi:prepilin-type N-terminal cleavage/methylation domain-containing protein